MSLPVKFHYTLTGPSLIGVETCCFCKWVTESPGRARRSMGKKRMDQFDKIVTEEVSQTSKVEEFQYHLKHDLAVP